MHFDIRAVSQHRTAQRLAVLQSEVTVGMPAGRQGDLRGAVTQLELATKSGDGDFYQLSVVDARLKELRSQHAAEVRDAKR